MSSFLSPAYRSGRRRAKILPLRSLMAALDRQKKTGKKVVFTNGCFDVLHVGHTRYLQKARSMGDRLVIGVNSDASVRQLKKGPGRPVNSENARAEVLAALECVDYIVIFGEPTPLRLIQNLRPDVLVKGGDWAKHKIVGAEAVESYGGRVKTVPFVQGFSTTRTLAKIQRL